MPEDVRLGLTSEQRLDLLKVEMTLIQGVFNKYDDMILRSRNWFITLWAAALGLTFTARVSAFLLMAAALAALYWVLEGMIRHQYWFKYVVRYRALRDELNKPQPDIEALSLYDLTHHYGSQRPSKWEHFWRSFVKLEPCVLYLTLGGAAIVLWRLVVTGAIPLAGAGVGGI